jgi:hypothetical protein
LGTGRLDRRSRPHRQHHAQPGQQAKGDFCDLLPAVHDDSGDSDGSLPRPAARGPGDIIITSQALESNCLGGPVEKKAAPG